MSETLASSKEGQYFNCIPVLSTSEVLLVQNVIDKDNFILDTLNIFACRADRYHQLDDIVKTAVELHDFQNRKAYSAKERENITEGVRAGYISTFGLFELINIIRGIQNSSTEAKPIFPLSKDETDSINFIQTGQLNYSNLFDNRHEIFNNFFGYFKQSPSTIDLLNQISESTYSLKELRGRNKGLKADYLMGFDQAIDPVLFIYRHIHNNRIFSKMSAYLLSSI